MDSVLRANCGVKLGDSVRFEKLHATVSIVDATAVFLKSTTPLEQSEYLVNAFLQQVLVGRYVKIGQMVATAMYGRTRQFTVSDIQPSPAGADSVLYRVTTRTKVTWEKQPRPAAQPTTAGMTLKGDYSTVGGLGEQIKLVRELVELPLQRPELFEKYGIQPPRGVLLYGPPGTGKTLLAGAVAAATGARCFQLSASDVVSKFYGESEAKLREVFKLATEQSPSIIFIDELDALAPNRDNSDSEVTKRVVGSLLALMDGIDSKDSASRPRFVVLAATNRPNSLDPALRRAGRFDREIEIPIPNEFARRDILKVHIKKMPHSLSQNDIEHIASITHGYVGADIASLCKEAAMIALKRLRLGSADAGEASHDPVDMSALAITRADMIAAMIGVRPSAMREVLVDIPKVKWTDIGGYEITKQKLKEAVEWPLKHPEAFIRMGIDPPRGVLLYGPPGCSKTLLAKALATEAGLNFIPIKGPELFNKYVGESERAVRDVFRKARQASPSVVFFDEIDAIGVERGSGDGGNSVHDRVIAQMLTELDGIEPLKNVLFLAATNRPDIIDKALMRPGRIDRILFVGPPDLVARTSILTIHLKKTPIADDVDIPTLAEKTDGFTGAELASIVREAALAAMQEDMNAQNVQMKHFVSVIQGLTTRTITKEMMNFFTQFSAVK